MDAVRGSGNDQAALWNSSAGCAWVDLEQSIDQTYKAIEDLLVEEIAVESPRRVLDVGCGTGATTVAAARRLGAASEAVGVDVSEPMIGAARARAEREAVPARFVVADAQAYAFEPSSFDAIMSRFGVMFFDDPVRAFENLWRAARPGAQLRLVTWRSPEENPFMTAAERAAAPLMPNLPPRVPDAPGQFGFADARRVHHILERSGWVQIDIRPIDVACTFPAQELPNYATRFGIVARALPDVDEQTRTRVVEAVLAGFAPYVHGGEVRYDAACWMISARAP